MSEHDTSESRRRGFEQSDAQPGWILLCGAAILFMLLVSLAGVAGINALYLSGGTPVRPVPGFNGGATQQTSIAEDRERVQADESSHLNGYRWIDPEQGMVRIPIDEAMRLIAEPAEEAP